MFIRPVFISAPLFWGFQRYVDLTSHNSIEKVIQYIISELREFLKFDFHIAIKGEDKISTNE